MIYTVTPAAFTKLNSQFQQQLRMRSSVLTRWRDLAQYYLPSRYEWLESARKRKNASYQGENKILDGAGTKALRVLASGLMDGITSPSRPWFKLGIAGFGPEDLPYAVRVWLDEVERRMLLIMAGSNFYTSLATNYIDLALFGTTCHIIYEDPESVIRSYVPAMGEFCLSVDHRGMVDGIYREFSLTVSQMKKQFGEEVLSSSALDSIKNNRAESDVRTIRHIIGENVDDEFKMGGGYKFREVYFEKGNNDPDRKLLSKKGFSSFPAMCPRWAVTGGGAYGTECPGMDALSDVKQLQHETLRKAQGLDKMVSPPMVIDLALKNNPSSMLPDGRTYVPSYSSVGAKAAYDVRLPIAEMTADLNTVKMSVREHFFVDLFQKITNLQTVRSAKEIDSIEGEKLTQLGPMLERNENEALDPGIKRVFEIGLKKNLFPPEPEELANLELEIQYISVLALAQSSVATAPTERLLAIIGQTAAIKPEVLDIIDWDNMFRNYAKNLGVRAADLVEKEKAAEMAQQRAEQQEEERAIVQGGDLVNAAKTLSETDVGGGANALQQVL